MLLVSAETMNKLQKQLQKTINSRMSECNILLAEIQKDALLIKQIQATHQAVIESKLKLHKSISVLGSGEGSNFLSLNPFANETKQKQIGELQ
jgi:hypothetical protein